MSSFDSVWISPLDETWRPVKVWAIVVVSMANIVMISSSPLIIDPTCTIGMYWNQRRSANRPAHIDNRMAIQTLFLPSLQPGQHAFAGSFEQLHAATVRDWQSSSEGRRTNERRGLAAPVALVHVCSVPHNHALVHRACRDVGSHPVASPHPLRMASERAELLPSADGEDPPLPVRAHGDHLQRIRSKAARPHLRRVPFQHLGDLPAQRSAAASL
eukprot:1613066-Rhodomonas_salina.2